MITFQYVSTGTPPCRGCDWFNEEEGCDIPASVTFCADRQGVHCDSFEEEL